MTVDALTRSRLRTVALYAATWRLLSQSQPYFMVAFHDYDLGDRPVRGRIIRYLARVSEFTDPTTLSEVGVETDLFGPRAEQT